MSYPRVVLVAFGSMVALLFLSHQSSTVDASHEKKFNFAEQAESVSSKIFQHEILPILKANKANCVRCHGPAVATR